MFAVTAAFGKCVRGQTQLPLQTTVEKYRIFAVQLPFFRSLLSTSLPSLTFSDRPLHIR